MNQPKFKLGDRVIGAGFSGYVKINGIREVPYKNKWEYTWAYQVIWAPEDSLDLYQEPQKKKLYAFVKYDSGWVGFRTDDTDRDEDMRRAPELDIEYPDKND